MPWKPKRPCRAAGCNQLAEAGQMYCMKHMDAAADRMRGNAAQRGYDSRWRAARKRYLDDNPLCVKCIERGVMSAATVVDHILPHRGNQELFWDEGNWQALCKSCHDEKTGKGL